MNDKLATYSNRSRLSRRQFLKITAISSAFAGLGALGIDALHDDLQIRRVQTTRLLLGTVANITLITDRTHDAEAAIEAAFFNMTALERVMSRFQPDSQLSHINASGEVRDPHPALVDVLRQAVYYGDLTGGAFDVTIEPVLALYRGYARTGQLPPPEEIDRQRALVNYHDLVIGAEHIRLRQPGMAITLDGIAKGYIIDQGAGELRRRGFGEVLVELGGDMQAWGSAGDRPWQIGLQSPRKTMADQTRRVTHIQDCALATSGDYMQPFTPDFRLHHILNPRTGASSPELSSASVIAPTACDADALATAAMVLGADKVTQLLITLPDTAGAFVDKAGRWHQTPNFPA
jgi:thiamine biosynthesis lipoprotein